MMLQRFGFKIKALLPRKPTEKGDVRVVPEFEEVRSHKRQAAGGVQLHHLQVLLRHLPHGGAAPLEQRRVVEIPL